MEEVKVKEQGPGHWTGGQVWPAARRIFDFLTAGDAAGWRFLKQRFFPDADAEDAARATRVLELGSGTGWLGLNLRQFARHRRGNDALPPSSGAPPLRWAMTLTEQAGDAMDWLVLNVDEHHPATAAAADADVTMKCDVLDWCDVRAFAAAVPTAERFDIVVGSDLLYHRVHIDLLREVFLAFLRSGDDEASASALRPARFVLYCHTFHRYDILDLTFFNHLVCDVGLCVHEVCGTEGSFELKPWSQVLAEESFMDDLFGTHRPAVMLIRLPPPGSEEALAEEAANVRSLGRDF